MESAPTFARPWLWPALASAGVAAVCLWRCLAGYLDPVLCGEDWAILFVRYLWDRSPGLVLEPYAGYLSLGPQGIGWLCAWLPAAAQAYALAFAAGAIAVAALGWFASVRFAHVLPDARARALVCVLLALHPIADAPLLCTTMYAHWHLLFVVCLAAIAAPPSPRARPIELLVVPLCVWSHPVALLIVPWFAWRAWRSADRGVRRHYACLTLLSLAYLAVGIDWQAPPSGSAPGWPGAVFTLLGGVILPSFTLSEGVVTLLEEHGWSPALVALPLAALLVAGLGPQPRESLRGARILPALVDVNAAGLGPAANNNIAGGPFWRRCAASALGLRPPAAMRGPALARVRPTTLTLVGLAVLIAGATVATRWAAQRHLVLTSPRYAYVPALLLSLWATSTLLRLGARRVGLVAVFLGVHAISLNGGPGVDARFRFAPRSHGRVTRFTAEVAAWARTDGPPGESRRLVLPGRVLEIRRPELPPR